MPIINFEKKQPQAIYLKSNQCSVYHPRDYQRDDNEQKTHASGSYHLLCDHMYSSNKMCEENAPASTYVPVTNKKGALPEQSGLLPSVFYQRAVYNGSDGNIQPQSLKGCGNSHKLSLKEICST